VPASFAARPPITTGRSAMQDDIGALGAHDLHRLEKIAQAT
jgi:hypothetical protein